MTDPVIEFRDVSFSFGDRPILDGVSFAMEEGRTRVIMGASGAGKSTILKLILGLLTPDAGEILVLGKDVTKMKPREMRETRHSIGMVFQGGALFDSLTTGENIGYCPRESHNLPWAEVNTRVQEALKRVGLEDVSAMMPSELSGGMKKRVAIARSIICRPKIMLYDEPTTGLDPIVSDTINDLIVSLREEYRVTSIVVTHIMRDAYHVGDVFTMLRDGKIIFDGAAAELKATTDPYIKEFIS
jgi:phospholipid/cholesterol/gamma-HCH transport system ATP-binding protein